MSFTRDLENKLTSLNVGKIQVIHNWLNDHNINGYKINDDLTITVSGGVYLAYNILNELPYFINFSIVNGDFQCDSCNLTTLRGCPLEVYGSFDCTDNGLNNLDYAPKKITGNFIAGVNTELTKEICLEYKSKTEICGYFYSDFLYPAHKDY